MMSTFTVFHDDDQLVLSPEELLVAYKEGYLILLNFIIETFEDGDLVRKEVLIRMQP